MASPKDIIAEAFEKLKNSISEEDKHQFASTELEDVWSAARQIESNQRKRLSAQNLRRIEPLLRGIEKYKKVIEVLCNGTPYMPYIWVSAPPVSIRQSGSPYLGSDQVNARGTHT
jgi:dsDNA-specific endonuclease/ATPase MutS2